MAKLEELLPHLIFVDLDACADEAAMEWVERVKTGPYHKIPISVFSQRTTVGRIQRSAQARVTDYILMPPHLAILTRKVNELCARSRSGGLYAIRPGSGSAPRVELRLEAEVTAISETGLQIRGPLQMTSVPLGSFETPLFSQIGVSEPSLRASNAARVPASGEPVNYFQVQGWSESDRKMLRHWIRARRLEAIK